MHTLARMSADEKAHPYVYRVCHQNDPQLLPLRTKITVGKKENRTALMGTGNRGISGKWARNFEQPRGPLAGRQKWDTEIPD